MDDDLLSSSSSKQASKQAEHAKQRRESVRVNWVFAGGGGGCVRRGAAVGLLLVLAPILNLARFSSLPVQPSRLTITREADPVALCC